MQCRKHWPPFRDRKTGPELLFEHRMCRDLGWHSVEAMRAGLTGLAFTRWVAFYVHEDEERKRHNRRRGRGAR